jgi:hypothetical protein
MADPEKSKNLEMLENVFESLMGFSQGGQVTSIGFNDRNVGYSTMKYDDLLKMYSRLRRNALKAGEIEEDEYPDMEQSLGGPMKVIFSN